jgi:hypothetical protein
MDCGPTCLRMVAKHYGKTYSLRDLRRKSHITREGVPICAKRFGSILELIERNHKIKVQLVLSPGADENSISLMKTIFKMKMSGQNREILEKLDIWYKTERSKRHELLGTVQDTDIMEGFEEMMDYNSMLFRTGKVTGVPSVYVDGYPLPTNYTLDDLKYHIAELESTRHMSNNIE